MQARLGCFAVRRGNLTGKADVASHNPHLKILLDLLDAGPFPVVDLRGLVREKGGIRYGTSSPPPILPLGKDTVPFVRATDIKEGEIQLDGLLYVHKDQPLQMAKCLLRAGEVIVVRSGVNTGDCASVPQSLEGAYGAYDLILRLREASEGVNPLFLTAFLDTKIGRTQLNVMKARSAQPHLNAEEVGSIRVPLPRPRDQEKLLAPLSAARGQRKKMLAGADALLASLDGFVLDQLGLTLPPTDDCLVYATRLGDAVRQRADPNFHTPRYRKLQRRLASLNAQPLGNIAKLSEERQDPRNGDGQDFRYIEISSVSAETGEALAVDTPRLEAPSRARMVVHDGNIIVSLTRPQRGSIALIEASLDGCIASTGFAVLCDIDRHRVQTQYLWAFLRTQASRLQMLQRSSGGNYPAITEDELKRVLVPIPDNDVQEAIIAEIARRRAKASRLRSEADAIWQQAKVDFEAALLRPAE